MLFDSPIKKPGKVPNTVVKASPKRRASLSVGDLFRKKSSSRSLSQQGGLKSEASLLTVTDDEHDQNEMSCASFMSYGTTTSAVQKIFESDAPSRLNSHLIVTVSNTWARVKRREGYEEDVGEAIIMAMMDLDPKTRENLRIKSFRSPRFGEICRAMADLIDMVVTLLGPDLDDEDLIDAGEGFREQGIDLNLFSQCVSAGIQARLTKRLWNDEVESAWQTTFKLLIPSMTVQ